MDLQPLDHPADLYDFHTSSFLIGLRNANCIFSTVHNFDHTTHLGPKVCCDRKRCRQKESLGSTCSSRIPYWLRKEQDINTKVFEVVSNPDGHSKGPPLHNPAFRHTGYDGIYVPLLVDNIKEFLRVYSCRDFSEFSLI